MPHPSGLVLPFVVRDNIIWSDPEDVGYTHCSMVKLDAKLNAALLGVCNLSPAALNNAEADPNFLIAVSVVTLDGVHALPISAVKVVPPAAPFMCNHDLRFISESLVWFR